MLTKNILKPGDGISFPKKGDYVKVDLGIYTKGRSVIYEGGVVTRYLTEEACFLKEIEDLIGEMSLYEKCSLDITQISELKSGQLNKNKVVNHDLVKEGLVLSPLIFEWVKCSKSDNLNIEVEIVNISNFPF